MNKQFNNWLSINLSIFSNENEEAIPTKDILKVKNYRMKENMESLTISSKNCDHMNLVKLQKNKADKTITLDILSCRLHQCKKRKSSVESKYLSENQKKLFSFSFNHLFHEDLDSTNNLIHFIRTTSLFWIILLNVTTVLSYASSKSNFQPSFNYLN